MLSLNSIMLGSDNPKKLADFYQKVLDQKPDISGDDWFGFDTAGCYLTIGFHDQVKGQAKNPERVILNFETREVEKEFKRIEKLGATVIAKPYSPMEDNTMTIATFADPDGNYFQLMSPWESGN